MRSTAPLFFRSQLGDANDRGAIEDHAAVDVRHRPSHQSELVILHAFRFTPGVHRLSICAMVNSCIWSSLARTV
jgi:hypothetical protein